MEPLTISRTTTQSRDRMDLSSQADLYDEDRMLESESSEDGDWVCMNHRGST